MKINQRIDAFVKLGSFFAKLSETEEEGFKAVCNQAYLKNNWFTRAYINLAVDAWSRELTEFNLLKWISAYDLEKVSEKKVGVINAGNIPLVGFHDMLSVLISGHNYIAKNSSDDNILLPYLASILIETEPAFKSRVHFVDRLTEFDAVIATGTSVCRIEKQAHQ